MWGLYLSKSVVALRDGWLAVVVGRYHRTAPTICRNSFVYSGFIQVPLKHASLNNILL